MALLSKHVHKLAQHLHVYIELKGGAGEGMMGSWDINMEIVRNHHFLILPTRKWAKGNPTNT